MPIWVQTLIRVYHTYIYITDLVCYTNFHWFFNHKCQHIFGKQTEYIFQSPKNVNMDDKQITLHWIKSIIRNNKCIFTKLNAVFILKTAVWKKNITTDNSVTNTSSIQQTPAPRLYHTVMNITLSKTLSLENFRRHGATPRFCLHVVNI